MNYFITAIHFEKGRLLGELRPRCFGYFEKKQDAYKAVEENACDIHECYYTHVVVEGISEGLYRTSKNERWYKWDAAVKKWIKCNKPSWAAGTFNWSIG